jgi:hypothetical protein
MTNASPTITNAHHQRGAPGEPTSHPPVVDRKHAGGVSVGR